MGHLVLKKARKKISKARTGKKASKQTRKKKSKSMKGEKNPMWIDGRTSKNAKIRRSLELRLWKESIFARDNFICQKCNQWGGKLQAHHIFNFADYPKLRFIIDNGITLCRKCHIEFHNKYGRGNNTKKQLDEFLKYNE